MAIKRPDIYEHNNPNNAIADSDFVRGGGRTVADLTELYALASKVDQLKENVTRVYVTSENKDYKLVDIADITAGVFNPTAWLLDTIDESNIVHINGDETINDTKTFTEIANFNGINVSRDASAVSSAVIETLAPNGTITPVLNLRAVNTTGGELNKRFINFLSSTPVPAETPAVVNLTIQGQSGTIALLSDLTSYIPIAGTTTITGDKTFTGSLAIPSTLVGGGAGFITGDGSGLTLTALNNGAAIMKIESNLVNFYGSYDITGAVHTFTTKTKKAVLDLLSISDSTTRTYTLPDVDGTFALTSDQSLINSLSTGVISFDGLAINTSTTFDVGAVKGWIIDNETDPTAPTKQYINYAGATNITATYVATNTSTYILLSPSSTIIQQTTFPTALQRRQNIFLGQLGHANLTNIVQVFDYPDIALSPSSQLRDILRPIHLINSGVACSANGANLSFNTSAGTLYGLGIGLVADVDRPNELVISSQTPTTFQYRTQTGGSSSDVTLIDPTMSDVAGTATAIAGSGNQATNQRIYLTQTGIVRVQYGQTIYANLTDAITASQKEAFVTFNNFKDNAILIGILSVIKGATDLSSTGDAFFNPVSKFGEATGGTNGISTTTMNQSYLNSATPQITVNDTLGSVDYRNGRASDASNVFRMQNIAGSDTVAITGAGTATFSGNIGIGATPTARLHLASGTATANTSPFKYTSGTNLTAVEDGAKEFDGTNEFLSAGGVRYTLAKTLTATATLDFDLTAVNYQDLTIPVPGAVSGDGVSIGVPSGAVVADVTYFGWVSAADTVSIRASRVGGGAASNPASGTFRASVLKY